MAAAVASGDEDVEVEHLREDPLMEMLVARTSRNRSEAPVIGPSPSEDSGLDQGLKSALSESI